jgi:hypothetical protein
MSALAGSIPHNKDHMKAIISKEPPIKIVPDSRYPDMYRLQWKDGSKSVEYIDPEDQPMSDDSSVSSYGMYNLTRAKDILKNYSLYVEAMKHTKRMRGNRYRLKAA